MMNKKQDKTLEAIIKVILEFYFQNGFPNELVSDNRPESKNTHLNSIYQKEEIIFIHGLPYNPNTQDMIERFHYFHYTIKKYLGKKYINTLIMDIQI